MIDRVYVGLAHNPSGVFEEDNHKLMSKQNGESLATINDYLNHGGRILLKERVETKLGTQVCFLLYRPDEAQP